jgi:hypothetical protein
MISACCPSKKTSRGFSQIHADLKKQNALMASNSSLVGSSLVKFAGQEGLFSISQLLVCVSLIRVSSCDLVDRSVCSAKQTIHEITRSTTKQDSEKYLHTKTELLPAFELAGGTSAFTSV